MAANHGSQPWQLRATALGAAECVPSALAGRWCNQWSSPKWVSRWLWQPRPPSSASPRADGFFGALDLKTDDTQLLQLRERFRDG